MSESMAHRLRNQLNQVVLETALLRGEAAEGSKHVRQLERVESLSLRLQQFASDLKASCIKDGVGSLIRVLIVEDDASQRGFLANAMRSEGFFVAEARDGNEAITYLHSATTPDVILMDISMPECDGHETNQVIRVVPFASHVKVLAVTALGENDFNSQAFDGYFQKPVDIERLVQQVREFAAGADAESNASVENELSLASV